MTRVTLLVGRGCHLCHDARAVLERTRERIAFELEEVFIDDDPALESEYRTQLPVVLIDGEKHFKYRVDAAELERRLRVRG